MSELEHLARAGTYVLGLMNDSERERAERDLEADPQFRDAVLKVAERMHKIDLAPQPNVDPSERWRQIAARISELPQMRGFAEAAPTLSPVSRVQPVGQGAHSVPSRRALWAVFALIAAFFAGYITALLRI